MLTLHDIEQAAQVVYRSFQATPQYCWGLSSQRLGADCWIKHENHTPVGAFKIRGGLTYFEALRASGTLPQEVVSATRGNHGQSIGWAARAHGVACTIVVPRGNSLEKNAAMRALGVSLVEHGDEFQDAREHAAALAAERGAHRVPSFHKNLVCGVATYWWEFFKAVPHMDVTYVPIGMGSGAAAAIQVKLALSHRAEIVGVVSAHATSYADSIAAGRVLAAPVTTRLADGMACRMADPAALSVLAPHLARIVQVTDAEVADAMRHLCMPTPTMWPRAQAPPALPPPCRNAPRCKARRLASRCAAAMWMPMCWRGCWRISGFEFSALIGSQQPAPLQSTHPAAGAARPRRAAAG